MGRNGIKLDTKLKVYKAVVLSFLLFACETWTVYQCHAFPLKVFENVITMPDEPLPKKAFYGELQKGKCSQGDQRKRYKDTLKASLKDFDIPMGSWEQTAQERSKWRGLIKKGAALYERESVKLKESTENAKPRPMGHQQIP